MSIADLPSPGRADAAAPFEAAVADTLKPLGEARHAPGAVYGSRRVFDLEKQKIFMREWLCVARSEEVANPGDYMTFRVLGEPFVVARNEEGAINAFANVCAHRGVEVATGEGNAKEFSCPYHGWLYDLNGRLVGAPYMQEAEGFDPGSCRLKRLRVGEWGGWVFINFDPEAEPLESFLAEFAADFGFLQPQNCRIGHKFTIDWKCNWKFVIENLHDVYHFKTVHAQTFADQVTEADQFKFRLRRRGGSFSRYSGVSFTPDGKPRVGILPWLAGEPEDFAVFGLLAPNFHILGRRDFIRPYFIWPIAPDTSRAVIYHLFDKDEVEKPGFSARADVYFEWYKKIYVEDISVVEALQRITESSWFMAERMSKMEAAIHHFITGHIERLMAP